MKWSPQQSRAIDAVGAWLKSDQQVFRLFGFAGVGKTTIAKHAAEQAGGKVIAGSFTGKAASVLRKAGWPDATTIHKLIYVSQPKSQEAARKIHQQIKDLQKKFSISDDQVPWIAATAALHRQLELLKKTANQPRFAKNSDSIIKDSDLVVIDECSMVNQQMGQDLESYGKKILVLGDPFQLPPVFGAGYFTEHDPDFLLTEIHRQARDNPIIDMCTRVRNYEQLPYGTYGDSSVVRKLPPEEWMAADQILCGKNANRVAINKRIRKLQKRTSDLPEVGDRLMCLRNNHERGLLNGGLWKCTAAGSVDNDEINITIDSEDDESLSTNVQAYVNGFNCEKPGEAAPWDADGAELFEYGYCASVHKFQGSQAQDIVLYDQSYCFPQSFRWLYTGLSRAQRKAALVRE